MTQNEIATIVAATTQSVLAALAQAGIAMPTVTNPATATKKGQGARSKVQEKPKALPDATSTAIDNIMAEASKEAVNNGKKLEVPKGKAYLFEFSEKMLAIWGDTKEHRETIKKYGGKKFGIIWGYQPEGASEPNLAEGWYIYKSKLEKAGGQKAFVAELKKAGLKVTIGESIRAITEAYRAAREKEKGAGSKEQVTATTATTTEKPKKVKGQGAGSKEKVKKQEPTKVLPIKTETFNGIAYGEVAIESGVSFIQYPDNPDLYIRKGVKGENVCYTCIGKTKGEDTFLYLCTIPASMEIPQAVKDTANEGILSAIATGKVKKVKDYVKDAFKSLDNQDGYKWLIEWLAAA